jgi:hypothetical protein
MYAAGFQFACLANLIYMVYSATSSAITWTSTAPATMDGELVGRNRPHGNCRYLCSAMYAEGLHAGWWAQHSAASMSTCKHDCVDSVCMVCRGSEQLPLRAEQRQRRDNIQASDQSLRSARYQVQHLHLSDINDGSHGSADNLASYHLFL